MLRFRYTAPSGAGILWVSGTQVRDTLAERGPGGGSALSQLEEGPGGMGRGGSSQRLPH